MDKKHYKIIHYLVLVIIAAFYIIGWGFTSSNKYDKYEHKAMLVTPDEQIDYEDGSHKYTILLNGKSDELNELNFYTNHQQVYVYADEELIYSVEKSDSIFGHSTGSHMNIVRIPYGCTKIEIATKPVFEGISMGETEIYIGDGVAMYRESLMDSLTSMLLCLFIIAIGFCLVIYYYLIRHDYESFKEVRALGLFSILLGIWALFETPGILVIVQNRLMSSYNGFFLLVMMNIPFIMFVKYFLSVENKKLHVICIIAIAADMTILTLLQILRIRDVKQNGLFAQMALAVSASYFVYAIIKAFKQRQYIRRAYINLFGAGVIIGTVILDLIAYYKDIVHANQISKFGFVIYILILAAETADESRRAIDAARKASFYKEMAIMDGLTDCYNRNAFNIDFEKIDTSKHPVGLVQFDLNNLKKCNDTEGHGSGDEYIKESAELIKRIFDKNGKVYRMGGDEFCVIMKETTEARVQTLVDRFSSEQSKIYAGENELNLGIACGYAIYDDKIDDNLEDTLKRADESMYSNKKEIKGIRE